jgi:RNA polymerase sigma-70 factor (ECF subfamily)
MRSDNLKTRAEPAFLMETLQELVTEARQGDKAAFERLVERYERRVFYKIYSYVGNVEDARDVLQEVFLTVYRKLGALKEAEKFEGWIYRIAVNRALDFLRRNSRHTPVLLNEEMAASEYGITEEAEQREMFAEMRRAVDRLAPKHRDVLLLSLDAENDQKRISAILGVSIGTVKSRLFYARERVGRIVSKYFREV